MTKTEYLEQICTNLGINVATLPDRMITTYLSAISNKLGVMKTNGTLGDYLSTFSKEFGAETAEIETLKTNFANMIEGGATEITVLDGVTVIGEYTFYRHDATRINIPASVTRINRSAFQYCEGCLVFDFSKHTTIPTLDTKVFDNGNSNAKIRVPSALLTKWKAATNWVTYASKIVGV